MNGDPAAGKWREQARRTMWHVNTGWWLQCLLLPVFVVAVLCSALILIARSQGWLLWPFLAGAIAALVVTALGSALVARRRFFRLDDALIRIEANARLHNRLTSAAAGIGAWPEFDAKATDGLGWKWKRIAGPLAGALICLAGSALVPIPAAKENGATEMQEPTSWSQVQDWVDQLKQEEVVQPPDIEQLEEQLQALRRQPRDQWYNHSSLEAGDQLRDQTRQGLQELDRNLALADSVLSQAMTASEEAKAGQTNAKDGQDGKKPGENGKPGENKSSAPKSGMDKATEEALQKQWEKALSGLKSGSMKLDPKTMSELSKIDPSKLKMIDPKQLKECKGKLSKSGKACSACLGKGGKDPKFAVLVESMTSGNASCNKPGAGGVSRGRGDAPLTFNKDETKAQTKGEEGLASSDLSNATIGDTIAVKDSAHHVDETAFKGPQAGGNAQDGGAGEAVWKTDVLPDEQQALERYFGDEKK